MPIELDQRKKPSGVKVHLSTGEGVEIRWADGHVSQYTFPYLRDHCPCANCRDERAREKPGSPNPLPMFKARVTAKTASAVGNYAIGIEFSDGHSTGIYSFSILREICPCEECRREFAGVQTA